MDADSSIEKDYPPRLYEEGYGPLRNRSMHHSCLLGHFTLLKDAIGEEVWDYIKKSSIGVILKLVDNNYVWGAKPVEYLLDRQLAIKREKEIWFLVRGQPIRFSLHEFEYITWLNCQPFPEDNCDFDHTDLWKLIGIQSAAAGPRYDDLKDALGMVRSWNFEQRRRFGCLFVVVVGLYGAPHNDALERYPWGRVAFTELINSVKVRKMGEPYNLHGCVHVLLIWAYETVTVFGEMFGNKKNVAEVPLLSWGGSRPRVNLDVTITKEVDVHGKVRIERHLIEKPAAEIYPVWSDDGVDQQLHNLILDLLNKRPIEHSWVVLHKNKKKRMVIDEQLSKGKSKEERGNTTGSCGESSKKKQKTKDDEKITKQALLNESDDEVRDQSSASGILKVVEQLAGRFDVMDTNMKQLGGKIDTMEKKIGDRMEYSYAIMDAKVDDKIKKSVSALETVLIGKIAEVQNELNKLRDSLQDSQTIQPASSSNGDDEANSTESLWKVHEKMTPGDNIPVQYVVKTSTKKKKLKESTNIVKKDEKVMSTMDDKKLNEKDGKSLPTVQVKIEGAVTKASKDGEKARNVKLCQGVKDNTVEAKKGKKDQRGLQECSDVEDITEQFREEEKKMCSASEDTHSDPVLQESANQLKNTINVLFDALGEDKTPTLRKRVPQLSKTQVWPYIGNSTMKRVITETPSEALYNPFEPADDDKVTELYDWMLYHEEQQSPGSKEELDFYKTLITPRKEWPTSDYGWLSTKHLVAALTMLRWRSLRDPCPFHSPRIAFLDPHFVQIWVSEYELFKADPRCFHFRQIYVEAMNGRSPLHSATNKKWVTDVDHLYLALNVQSDHWVALDVNLVSEKIFVYDSIIRHTEDTDIVEACNPISRMLPYMLNIHLPETRKPSKKKFGVHRYKTIPKNKSKPMPQNDNPGDCGVYAFKYIECLALGVSLEGLSDNMIQRMRVKMAVDILDEVPERAVYLSHW